MKAKLTTKLDEPVMIGIGNIPIGRVAKGSLSAGAACDLVACVRRNLYLWVSRTGEASISQYTAGDDMRAYYTLLPRGTDVTPTF